MKRNEKKKLQFLERTTKKNNSTPIKLLKRWSR